MLTILVMGIALNYMFAIVNALCAYTYGNKYYNGYIAIVNLATAVLSTVVLVNLV